MRWQWKFPDDVCGNSDDVWIHAYIVLYTLICTMYAPEPRQLTLVLFALFESIHGFNHYFGGNGGPWPWAAIHYTALACAYSIKPMSFKFFYPFLLLDSIGHLIGNDMLSIFTTVLFTASRLESRFCKQAIIVMFALFAFMELHLCEAGDNFHEAWDSLLGCAMVIAVTWYSFSDRMQPFFFHLKQLHED